MREALQARNQELEGELGALRCGMGAQRFWGLLRPYCTRLQAG
jgi:hypothetical protein